MAEATQKTPTAANIISSLGVKGAISSIPEGAKASKYAGFVPVPDANGMHNATSIPPAAAQLSIPPLSNVAYVDPYTKVNEYADDGETRLRVGSVVAPFKSIEEAAANFSPTSDAKAGKYVAFVLAPGKYDDSEIVFQSGMAPLSVYLIGTGECRFADNIRTLAVSGMSSAIDGRRPLLFLQGVYMSGTVSVPVEPDAIVIGKSYIGELNIGSGSKLKLSSDSRVSSTDAGTVSYLSEDSRIGNTSGVKGDTVKDAVGRLGRRKVRISKITADSSGIDIDSSSFVDVSETSSSGYSFGVFDLRMHDRVLVESIKRLFDRGKNIVADSVTTKTVVADSIRTKELRMDSLAIGGYRLEIDAYGYLVVSDRSANPPSPPDSVVLIRDTGSSGEGAIYLLGVSNGRLFIDQYDDGSSSPVENVLSVYDPDTGYEYAVSVDNGRVVIDRIEI